MQVSPIEGHRIWSGSYERQPNPLLALETRVLHETLLPLNGKRCVDIACGTGRWMTYAQSRCAHVIGVDACREMLLEAAPKPGLAGRLVLGQAGLLPLGDEIADLVLCSFALGYVPNPAGAIREMARIASARARIVVTDLHPRALEARWTRSFRAGDVVYEIEHFPYSTADLIEIGEGAGLRLEDSIDAHFGEPERSIFRSAGKDHLFSEMSRIPAVWMASWVKL